MADLELPDLAALAAPALTDILYIVDDPAGTPVDNKITIAALLATPSATFVTPIITGPALLYGLNTDGSNYERLSISHVNGTGVVLAAQTLGAGADNLNITLTPAGLGGVIASGWLDTPELRINGSAPITVAGMEVNIGVAGGFSGAVVPTTLRFAGSTASFPALKRSTTYLQVKLADDSAFAGLQLGASSDALHVGTHAAVTTEVVSGFITIKDSGGTDRKIAVIATP